MQLFLDTADYDAIARAHDTGLINGVTTNPTHLARQGSATELVCSIAQLIDPLPVSVEVTAQAPQEVYTQAHAIAQLGPNVVVKVPCYTPYVPIIHHLVHDGIPLNITLVFSAVQALCMAKLEVQYISPFIGRLDDIAADGLTLIDEITTILENYTHRSKVLAASLRSIEQVAQVAQLGADVATIPVHLFDTLLEHPLTRAGMKKFDEDWKSLGIDTFP